LFRSIEVMLLLTLAARFDHAGSRRSLIPHGTPCAARLDGPVLVLAGDSSDAADAAIRARLAPLRRAAQGFGGTLVSGGTTVGVSALAGDLAEALGARAIGYSPGEDLGDAAVEADPARYVEVRRTDGDGFGIGEPLRYWADILLSKISPTRVCVLGIGGGTLSSLEYRLALALGAWVGVLRESGRGAGALLADPDWRSSSRLFELGADPAGLRAFFRKGGLVTGDLADEMEEAPAARVPPEVHRRTFMFTDIEGSTNLIEAIGDQAWQDLRTWHDRTLRAAFEAFGGEEVDSAGDGFFVGFPDPGSAIACAIRIQRTLEEHRRDAGFAPKVRIGLHEAEAIGEAGRWFGKGVHVAARIGSAAHGGQILASATTVEGTGDVRTSDSQALSLKGLQDEVEVVALEWR
jgi:class 3 adenylate cyclase